MYNIRTAVGLEATQILRCDTPALPLRVRARRGTRVWYLAAVTSAIIQAMTYRARLGPKEPQESCGKVFEAHARHRRGDQGETVLVLESLAVSKNS